MEARDRVVCYAFFAVTVLMLVFMVLMAPRRRKKLSLAEQFRRHMESE